MLDLLIIGGGPAGLSAAENAASEGLSVRLLERGRLGGQAGTSSRIENYLGFPNGVSGERLARLAAKQAQRLGADLRTGQEVKTLHRLDDGWRASCQHGHHEARTVLLASGVDWRHLAVPGIAADEPVLYGATPTVLRHFKGRTIALVGAANSAGQAAIYAADHGARVLVLARSAIEQQMSSYLVARVRAAKTITVKEGVSVTQIIREPHGLALSLTDGSTADVSALLPYIGAHPVSAFVPATCQRDPDGYVLSDDYSVRGETGLFVAGDLRSGSRKRVATATGEGATVIASVLTYLH